MDDCADEEGRILNTPPVCEDRRMSGLSVKALIQRDRTQALASIRNIINNTVGEQHITEADLDTLLTNSQFSQILFGLFDLRSEGWLSQSTWFENLRNWAQVI